MWGWEANAVFPQLLRKLYPSGQTNVGNRPAAVVLARWIGFPDEVVEAALEELTGCGTVVVMGGTVTIPNFRSYHFGQGRPPGAGNKSRNDEHEPGPINAFSDNK